MVNTVSNTSATRTALYPVPPSQQEPPATTTAAPAHLKDVVSTVGQKVLQKKNSEDQKEQSATTRVDPLINLFNGAVVFERLNYYRGKHAANVECLAWAQHNKQSLLPAEKNQKETAAAAPSTTQAKPVSNLKCSSIEFLDQIIAELTPKIAKQAFRINALTKATNYFNSIPQEVSFVENEIIFLNAFFTKQIRELENSRFNPQQYDWLKKANRMILLPKDLIRVVCILIKQKQEILNQIEICKKMVEGCSKNPLKVIEYQKIQTDENTNLIYIESFINFMLNSIQNLAYSEGEIKCFNKFIAFIDEVIEFSKIPEMQSRKNPESFESLTSRQKQIDEGINDVSEHFKKESLSTCEELIPRLKNIALEKHKALAESLQKLVSGPEIKETLLKDSELNKFIDEILIMLRHGQQVILKLPKEHNTAAS